MANPASGFGELQRSGVQVRKARKARKSRKNVTESRVIRESMNLRAFSEKGIDEQQGKSGKKNRVYLVTIIEEGLGNSKDKNYYSGEALTKAPKLFNGSKAFCDHPSAIEEKSLPERSMRDLVGWYTNCFADKNPKTNRVRLRGKLHFYPDAKWLTDKIDTILSDPEAPPDTFGISINAVGKTRPAQMGGDLVNYVEAFQKLDSADVVTEPAARGKFEKILESSSGARKGKVTPNMKKRMREATATSAGLQPKQAKKVADSLTAAYHSDNPDEMKQAIYEATVELYDVASISGKGPGQSNEEQYSNINPAGTDANPEPSDSADGGKAVPQRKVKASRRDLRIRKKKHMKAAAGTGPDNEDEGEPSPEDIPHEIREADVEDEEGSGLGEFDDFGDSSKKKQNREAAGDVRRSAARPARRAQTQEDEGLEGLEDEGLEDEGAEGAEGMEDEGMEDEHDMGGGDMGGGGAPAMPSGGSSPRMTTSEADGGSDSSDEGSMGDSDGSDIDMSEADDFIEQPQQRQPRAVPRIQGREARRRRHSKEAGGVYGKAGGKTLTPQADPEEGYDAPDQSWGKKDSSTSGVGKSYKIKTSSFSRNTPVHRAARKVAKEANRRIEILESGLSRLKESLRGKERLINRYKGIVDFHNSKVSAKKLLREAVKREMISEEFGNAVETKLWGLSRQEQVEEIKYLSRFREAMQSDLGGDVRLMESVDGIGARGGAASRGTAANVDSELTEAMANDGIPMVEQQDTE